MTAQTPEPQSLVQTVRAALEAATTGPWIADDNDIWSADGDRFIGSPPRIADADLTARIEEALR